MSAAVLDESGEDRGGGGGGEEEEEELTNLSWLHNCGALSLSNGIGGGANSSKVKQSFYTGKCFGQDIFF